MNARADLHRPEDLPIPLDARVGKGWTGQMVEMADHIGAHATLLVVDRFGGQYLYIAVDPEQNRLRDVLTPAQTATMSHVYGRERLRIPVARVALAVARREGIIAAVRAHKLGSFAAARMLRTSQTYLSHLVNQTDEGQNAAPTPPAIRDARQLDMFGD